jgi:tetratricopeptide (TPR) repeat protein
MIYREVGDTSGVAGALAELGRICLVTGGDPEEIRRLLEESLSLSKASGQPFDVDRPLGYLGELAMTQRDDEQARRHIEASLAAFRQEGDLWGVNWCRINLGFLDLLAGDRPHARAHLEESLDVAGRLGVPHHVGVASLGLARLHRLDGDIGRAQAELRDSARLFRDVGTPAIYDALSFLGEIAVHQHNYAQSARLFAAGAKRRTRYVPIVCSVYAAACRPEWEGCLVAARLALGEDEFAAGWSEGQAMTLEQAVACALGEDGG